MCLEFPKFCPICVAPLFCPACSPTLNLIWNNETAASTWLDSDIPSHLGIPHAPNLLLAEVPPVLLRHLRPQSGARVLGMLLGLQTSLHATSFSEKRNPFTDKQHYCPIKYHGRSHENGLNHHRHRSSSRKTIVTFLFSHIVEGARFRSVLFIIQETRTLYYLRKL